MRILLILALVPAVAAACATNTVPAPSQIDATMQPQIHALNTYSSRLGRTIEIYGSDFPSAYRSLQNGIVTERPVRLELVFRGNYDTMDGGSIPVDESFEAERRDNGTLRWTTFGPYRVPFGNTDTVGTFYGTIGVRQVIQNLDGTDEIIDDPQPLAITFDVEPSLVVREFQPINASCLGPAKRAWAARSTG